MGGGPSGWTPSVRRVGPRGAGGYEGFLAWVASIDERRRDRVGSLAQAAADGGPYSTAELVAALWEWRRSESAGSQVCIGCGHPIEPEELVTCIYRSGVSTWHETCRLVVELVEPVSGGGGGSESSGLARAPTPPVPLLSPRAFPPRNDRHQRPEGR